MPVVGKGAEDQLSGGHFDCKRAGYGDQRVRRPQVSDGCDASVFNDIRELQMPVVSQTNGLLSEVGKNRAGPLENDPARSGIGYVPCSMRPLTQIRKMSVAPRNLRIQALSNIGKTIIHAAGIVLQPITLHRNGAIGPTRPNEQVVPGTPVVNLCDFAADLRKDGDDQSGRLELNQCATLYPSSKLDADAFSTPSV